MQMTRTRQLAVVTLVATMTLLAGCASTGYGNAGEDSAEGADVLTERKVIQALENTPSLSGQPIIVGCAGGVVTLSGRVNSAIERQLAEKVAASVEGVTQVNNNIQTAG